VVSDQTGQISVLVVDDEAAFREALARRLGRRDFAVHTADGGARALERLERGPVDVVVLDVKMPGMDGLELLDRVRAGHPGSQVILLTGQASAADGVAGIKRGAFDYLAKPVELDHLAEKIRQAWELSQAARRREQDEHYRQIMGKRLASAERLASLGTLAAGVAHEINNPLAIIHQGASWLETRLARQPGLPEGFKADAAGAVEKMLSAVERARQITHQLLNFAKKEEWDLKEMNMAELVQDAARLARGQADKAGAVICLEGCEKPVNLYGDPAALRRVLASLIDNAVQASSDGGRITIGLAENGDDAVIRVSDQGEGIPRENLERIFEPFFSTRPPGQGKGLGLSVSRSLIEKLGGRMEVDSRPGRGSVFELHLPRHPSLAEEDAGNLLGFSKER
jgi:two-component system NtrC family sensor kinase